jgi:AcrR family transcriptional regulator
MTTLRQRQKRKREKDILDAAEKLIKSRGYLGTSIEDIADKAEVGVGTVYNYFQSKPKLLMALFRRYHLELQESGAAIVDNPPADAMDALCTLIRVYFEGPVNYFPKEYIRELFSVVSNEHFSIRRESTKLDYLIVDQISELVKILQDRDQIRKDIPSGDLSMFIYSIFATASMVFIYDDEATVDSTIEFLHHNLQLAYNGLKP